MSDSSDSGNTVNSRASANVATRQKPKPMRVSTDRGKSDAVKSKIKVPAFSAEDPELWFALIEGQFSMHDVTDDFEKFTHVTNNLDLQYAKAVKDIIVHPPPKHRYEKLKSELVKRLSASHEKKVRQLLTHEELGDRKPSQFLRHLQDLAGPAVPEDFIRSIWSNRLPHNIQTVLASQPTHSLEQLADLADRIQELTAPCTVATATSTSAQRNSASEEIAELKKMVQQLTLKLDEHTRASCCSAGRPSRAQERRRSSPRHRSRSRSSYQKYPVCWYHAKFGPQAHKCDKPCDYHKAGNATGSR
ncbi:uncharacterized protein LOC124630896 [Helicoverpa zea]|uniref:uncharacterized protein LOC124630896 n=1 Tax=Helicoverpa zea TaxID=7113 RepID=UPI001F56D567|nr:uncharacterized protein LOC124630896 [Helicoverpa zea]XP_049696845.1 uncharacterized protein LOC126054623 [Helicoverpa armigera]XP_049697149.1 uncharacterized protein LOC126054689 [Helicoverpa armigera]XP_049706816.1 uncharacterized protein LOC126056784 [Helicoverpa armigera]